MTNTAMFHQLIEGYNKIAFTHKYMLGFADRKNVYCAVCSAEILPYVCTLDSATRGAGLSLRYKPTNAQKDLLRNQDCFLVCSMEMFESECKANKTYNRGEVFEKIITERFGLVWKKDHVPFTEAGDIEVDGIAYQIKYEKATFVNEKTLARLGA